MLGTLPAVRPPAPSMGGVWPRPRRPYPHAFGKSESEPPPMLIILHRYTNWLYDSFNTPIHSRVNPEVEFGEFSVHKIGKRARPWAHCAPRRPPFVAFCLQGGIIRKGTAAPCWPAWASWGGSVEPFGRGAESVATAALDAGQRGHDGGKCGHGRGAWLAPFGRGGQCGHGLPLRCWARVARPWAHRPPLVC